MCPVDLLYTPLFLGHGSAARPLFSEQDKKKHGREHSVSTEDTKTAPWLHCSRTGRCCRKKTAVKSKVLWKPCWPQKITRTRPFWVFMSLPQAPLLYLLGELLFLRGGETRQAGDGPVHPLQIGRFKPLRSKYPFKCLAFKMTLVGFQRLFCFALARFRTSALSLSSHYEAL